MKIECVVTNVAAVESPDRAQRAILEVILVGRSFSQFRVYSSNKFTPGHLMKIEWLVANKNSCRSPDRAEHAILEVILTGRVFR